MRLPFPLLWLALTAMWLLLTETVTVGQAVVGALVSLAAVAGLARLQPASDRLRRPWVLASLAGVVLVDVVRSNVDVARSVLRPGTRGRVAGFVEIPLDTRHPAVLAGLACIITATPGTSWAGYDSSTNVLTMHILDLVDDAAIVRTIKERYERRLVEVFG